MTVYRLRQYEISFPTPDLAREDGLLAVGGDLSVDRLLLAYTHGIFPWYNPGEEILWWCPRKSQQCGAIKWVNFWAKDNA